MNETELENLVVNLTGDGSEYVGMLHEAEEETEQVADEIEKSTKDIEGFANSIQSYAKAALETIGGLVGLHFLKEAVGEWDLAERTAIRLESAIKANGGSVEDLMPKYGKFAAELQKITEIGDDATLAVIRQAESFGLSGAKAIKATKDATGLAAATSGNAESMIRLTAAMAQGDVNRAMMFARMVPQLRGVKDETEFMAKYQNLVNAGLESAQKEAGTLTGRLTQLKNAWGDLQEEIGKIVSDAVKPLVDVVSQAVEFMASLSEETKATIVTVMMLVTAVILLTGAITAAWAVFNTLTGGMSTGLLLIGGLVTAAVLGFAGLATSMGGLGAMFEQVKEKAIQAWEWLKPVRQAVMSFFGAVKEIALGVWESIKAFAVETWNSIAGSATVNWEKIRSTIVDAILMAEFVLRNFGKVMDLTWTLAALAMLKFVNDFEFFFTDTIPELLNWFADQFPNIIIDAIDMATQYLKNELHNWGTLFSNVFDVIMGKKSIDQLAEGLINPLDGVKSVWTDAPKITQRAASEAEQVLADDAARQMDELGKGWEKFRADKLNAFANEGDAAVIEESAEEDGEKVGEAFAEAAKEQVDKFDQALSGSAEALARISEYQDRLNQKPGGAGAKGAAAEVFSGGGARGMTAAASGSGTSATGNELQKQTVILSTSMGYLKTIAERPPVEFSEANF